MRRHRGIALDVLLRIIGRTTSCPAGRSHRHPRILESPLDEAVRPLHAAGHRPNGLARQVPTYHFSNQIIPCGWCGAHNVPPNDELLLTAYVHNLEYHATG